MISLTIINELSSIVQKPEFILVIAWRILCRIISSNILITERHPIKLFMGMPSWFKIHIILHI